MKPNFLKVGLIALFTAGFLFTGCSKDESQPEATETASLTAEQSKQSAEADGVSNDVFNVLEMAYAEIEEAAGRNASLFPECVTITIASENGVTFVTLDFGLGCQLNNGAFVSGIVNLTYSQIVAGTRTITVVFNDFTYNNKGIRGGGTIYRERNNAQGNPQSTVNIAIEVTFQNGTIAQVQGTRVAEWIEGVGSGTWLDNVFSITGDRDIEFSTGFTHQAIVIEALRREVTCHHFVSGVIEITRNNGNGSLDFGDGTCDNLATLTINGEDIIIILP
jgi:hypothetical protein